MERLRNFTAILLAVPALALAGCGARGYDLAKPDLALVLPDPLHEVSGLTVVDDSTVACIQDENGIIFIYDLGENRIRHQYSFNLDGDYEGITLVGNTMYVLRSDGTLYEIADYASPDFQLKSFDTGIAARNNEGLCHDPDGNRLLIASKGRVAKGREFKDKRLIHSFDLDKKTLAETHAFEFDLQKVKQFALSNKIDLPTKTKKKGRVTEPVIKFMTSAIAIHPRTRKLYLLSASDHLFFVFGRNGAIEQMVPLDPVLFNKAEGIAFFENGDMLITNEGQDRRPTLLRFNYGRH